MTAPVDLGRRLVPALLARDMAETLADPPCGTPQAPVCSGTFYIFPESVQRLAEELCGKVEFAWGPEVMPYGMREFGIRDPNGYYLAFTEPA